MNLIKQEIKIENAKEKPDFYYLKMLKSFESKDEIPFEMFSNTGRIIPAEVFHENNPELKLSPECTDVIRYLGGFFIQMLKSGRYIYEYNVKPSIIVQIEHKSLDIIELQMWQKYVQDKLKIS